MKLVAETTDLHQSITLGVDHELVFEVTNLPVVAGTGDRRHLTRGLGSRWFRSCTTVTWSLTQQGSCGETFLIPSPLVAVLATDVYHQLIERSGCKFAERFAEHGVHSQIVLISL